MQNQTGIEICISCGEEVAGKFCSNCGQKKGIGRLTWSSLLNDLQKRLFGFDNNFFRTVRDLTIAPKKVVHAILEGVRIRYIGPVGYFFLLLTIYVLLIPIIDVDIVEMSKEQQQLFSFGEQTPEQQELGNKFTGSIFENFRIFSFILIPFFVFSNWLWYRKKGFNMIENSVVVFYGLGHAFILNIIQLFIYKITGEALVMEMILLSAAYFVWICISSYPRRNVILAFFRGASAYVVGFLFFFIGIIIGSTILVIINPELFK